MEPHNWYGFKVYFLNLAFQTQVHQFSSVIILEPYTFPPTLCFMLSQSILSFIRVTLANFAFASFSLKIKSVISSPSHCPPLDFSISDKNLVSYLERHWLEGEYQESSSFLHFSTYSTSLLFMSAYVSISCVSLYCLYIYGQYALTTPRE